MSNKNVNSFKVPIKKDETGYYGGSKHLRIECSDDSVLREEYINTEGFYDSCKNYIPPGATFANPDEIPAPHTLCVVLQTKNNGIVWVSKDTYETQKATCNDCCES